MWHYNTFASRGSAHRKTGAPCQDKICVREKDGAVAAALADGAGSAACAEDGAACAAACISAYLLDQFDVLSASDDGAAVKRELLAVVRRGLALLADARGCALKDLASTLLAVAVKDGRYLIVHVGDGVIGYQRGPDISVASAPQNGAFMNETTFVTSTEAALTMRVMKGALGSITGFVLMSDGTAAALYDRRGRRLAPAAAQLFSWTSDFTPETAENNLRQSFKNIMKKTTDDCSIVVLARCAAARPAAVFPLPGARIAAPEEYARV